LKASTDMRVPCVTLDRRDEEPLHRQIVRQIAAAIGDGTLSAGAHLPSSRSLAKILRVSRNTVVTAYDLLAASGLIRATRGSGVRVNGAAPLSETTVAGMRSLIDAAHFPANILRIEDPDANPIYIRY